MKFIGKSSILWLTTIGCALAHQASAAEVVQVPEYIIPDLAEKAQNFKPEKAAALPESKTTLELGDVPLLNFHPIQQGFTANRKEYQVSYEPQRMIYLITLKNSDGSWVEETINWSSRRDQPGARSKLIVDIRTRYGIRFTSKQITRLFEESEKMEQQPVMAARTSIRGPGNRPVTKGTSLAEDQSAGICFENGPNRTVRPCVNRVPQSKTR